MRQTEAARVAAHEWAHQLSRWMKHKPSNSEFRTIIGNHLTTDLGLDCRLLDCVPGTAYLPTSSQWQSGSVVVHAMTIAWTVS